MDHFSVFFSYKEADGPAVESAKRALSDFAREHLQLKPPGFKVFMARDPECMQAGEPWRTKLHERLMESDWFVLFYTIPNTSWDWCMYEGGIFEGGATAKERETKTIGIVATDMVIPGPLRQLQVCWATKDAVRDQFVVKLIEKVGLAQPGNDPTLPEDIETLCDALLEPFKPYVCLPRLSLHAGGRCLLPTVTIACNLKDAHDHGLFFDNAEVIFSGSAGSLLNTANEAVLSFSGFCALLAVTSAWVDEIRSSLLCVMAAPDEIAPWQVVIVTTNGDHRRVFRPVLTDAYTRDEKVMFDICLVELLDDSDQYEPSLNRTFRLLRICHSYRVELVSALKNIVAPSSQPSKFPVVLRRMENLRSKYTQYGLEHGENPIATLPECLELTKAAAYFKTLEKAFMLYVRALDKGLDVDAMFEVIRRGFDQVNGRWLHVLAATYMERVATYKPTSSVQWPDENASLQNAVEQLERRLDGQDPEE